VQASSVAPVALSMTATVASSLPLSVAFVSAYKSATLAPLANVPASGGLGEKALALAGQRTFARTREVRVVQAPAVWHAWKLANIAPEALPAWPAAPVPPVAPVAAALS
jgi:hypothetical protein